MPLAPTDVGWNKCLLGCPVCLLGSPTGLLEVLRSVVPRRADGRPRKGDDEVLGVESRRILVVRRGTSADSRRWTRPCPSRLTKLPWSPSMINTGESHTPDVRPAMRAGPRSPAWLRDRLGGPPGFVIRGRRT